MSYYRLYNNNPIVQNSVYNDSVTAQLKLIPPLITYYSSNENKVAAICRRANV